MHHSILPHPTITLVLITGVLAAAFREKWSLAGGLIYKPQLAAGSFLGRCAYQQRKQANLPRAAVFTYLGVFLLLPLSALTGIVWVAILPIGLFLATFRRMQVKNSKMTWEQGIQ